MRGIGVWLEKFAAWLLALLWISPLLYAFWAAFHPAIYATRFELFAPLTLDNFREAWDQAPFARYYLNTFLLVTGIVIAQFVLCTLAAYAFARIEFSRTQYRVCTGTVAVDDHAGSTDR